MAKKSKSLFDAMGNVNGRKLVATAHSLLSREAHVTTGLIQAKFYSKNSNNSLGVRTGQARRGWRVKSEGRTVVAIVNNVPHADQREKTEITPKTSSFLAIPVGPALTKAGVARAKGPRDPAIKRYLDPSQPYLRFAGGGSKALVLLGRKKGNKKKESIFFVLKDKVILPARLKGLDGFVDKRGQMTSGRISNQLFRMMVKG